MMKFPRKKLMPFFQALASAYLFAVTLFSLYLTFFGKTQEGLVAALESFRLQSILMNFFGLLIVELGLNAAFGFLMVKAGCFFEEGLDALRFWAAVLLSYTSAVASCSNIELMLLGPYQDISSENNIYCIYLTVLLAAFCIIAIMLIGSMSERYGNITHYGKKPIPILIYGIPNREIFQYIHIGTFSLVAIMAVSSILEI
ncbi:MAG: hypothetical protein QNL04_03840 [SAR324 cluster bacterium]|nr:hypothetical protein [SAR324 cluster bacterium]